MASNEELSIYAKLGKIQLALQDVEFKKSGKNNFRNFSYYELGDLLPPIVRECAKHGIAIFFTFHQENGVLHLVDEEGCSMCVEVPFPEIMESMVTNNDKTMNAAQWEGSIMTYLKRYLLLNTFMIAENEVIDSNEKPAAKNRKTVKKSGDKKPVPKVLKKYASLNPDKKTVKAAQRFVLNQRRENEISDLEKHEAMKYIRRVGVDDL